MVDKSLDLGAMSVIWRGCGAETGYMRHALEMAWTAIDFFASLNAASHFLKWTKMENRKKMSPDLTVTIGLDSSESFIQDVFRKKVFWGRAVHLTRWVSGSNDLT